MSKETFDIIIGVANILILCITGYFIYRSIYSPVDAVKIGRDLNKEQQKDNAKSNLFLLLFSLRGNPTHSDFVRGLNEIDVVYQDNPDVLTQWHIHFRDLHDKSLTDPLTIWEVGRIRVLSAMATVLRYGSLNQTDILQHYTPEAHGNKEKFDYDLQLAALKYFEKGLIVFDEMLINTPSYVKRKMKEQKKKKKENDKKEI